MSQRTPRRRLLRRFLVVSCLAVLATCQMRLTNTDWNVVQGQPFTITWTGAEGAYVAVSLYSRSPARDSISLVGELGQTSDSYYTAILSPSLPLGEYAFAVVHGALYQSPFFELNPADIAATSPKPSPSAISLRISTNTTNTANKTAASSQSSRKTATSAQGITAPTSLPDSLPDQDETKLPAGLSGPERAGIGIGVTVSALLLISVVAFFARRARRTRTKPDVVVDNTTSNAQPDPQSPQPVGGSVPPTKGHWVEQVYAKEVGRPQEMHELPAELYGGEVLAIPRVSQTRLIALRADSPAELSA